MNRPEAGLTRTYILAGAAASIAVYVLVLAAGLIIAAGVADEGDELHGSLRLSATIDIGLVIAAGPTVEADELYEAIRVGATIAASAIGFGLVPWLMLRMRGATDLLGPPRPTMRDWGIGALGFVAALVAVYAYVGIVRALGLESLEPVSTISDDSFYEHVSVVVLLGISAVLVAPVMEEVFFRGFLVGALSRAWSAPIALFSSSAVFAALHFDVGSMIPFALIGLVFGALYLRTKSVAAPVIAHLGFNVVGYFGSLINQGVL